MLAELQCGDAAIGDAALAAAMRRFRVDAAALAMADWPGRFWGLLLAEPALRRHGTLTVELEVTDRLARLGSGPRAALLLRLAAGLEAGELDWTKAREPSSSAGIWTDGRTRRTAARRWST